MEVDNALFVEEHVLSRGHFTLPGLFQGRYFHELAG